MKNQAYERQKCICIKCSEHFAFNEIASENIVSWIKDGKTTAESC